jgi:DNA modification methylase
VTALILNMETNKVIQGDCLEVMKDIPDKSIDMVLTSPPYDNLRDYNGYTFDFEGIARELYRVLKDGGVCVWIVGDATIKGSETGTSFKQALYFKEIGFNLHDTMIYEKSTALPCVGAKRYYQIFEYMFILSKGNPKVFNPMEVESTRSGFLDKTGHRRKDGTGFSEYSGERKKTRRLFNVWRYAVGLGGTTNDKIAFQHPAIFPEKLAEDHILSWSNEGDTILDPMAGSGTTLKMAKKNNRNYIGIEISSEYIEIINKRLSQ